MTPVAGVPRAVQGLVSRYLEPRILDFGCGFGRGLVGLLEHGLDAWGVDISAPEVEKAKSLLHSRGFDAGRVALLDPSGRAPFPDATFDIVFSDQVLEHVRDLTPVVGEVARLLARDGVTVHQWPARWRPVEGHLFQPFVHWLPKNRSRRALISFWTRLGVGGDKPPELGANASRSDLLDFLYRYSVDQTFYRAPRIVEDAFRASGLVVTEGRGGRSVIESAGLDLLVYPRLTRVPVRLEFAASAVQRHFRAMTLVAWKPRSW